MGKYTQVQKKILAALLDRYEASRTYRGENRVRQSFRVKAEEIWPAYADNFTDVAEVEGFEREAEALEAEGLILLWRRKSGELLSFQAAEERLSDYYSLLGRKEKKEAELSEKQMYVESREREDALGAFCRAQLELLEKGRRAKYRPERAALYIALMKRILGNEEELYERELSTEILHDSKCFERSYRRTLCAILREYGDYEKLLEGENEERIIQMQILEKHRVFSNPGYVYVKGKAKLFFFDGSIMELKAGMPLGLSSDYIAALNSVEPETERILTIENLTAFHRFSEEGFFCIYLAGYHSHQKTAFLKKIADPGRKRWFHFGDLDPDGFHILKNLCRKSGLDFAAYHMEARLLESHGAYARKLEENDRVKAEHLIAEGVYPEVLREMLRLGKKLEQEALFSPGDAHR